MAEETQNQNVNELPASEEAAASSTEIETSQDGAGTQEASPSDVDERGVDWKNVAGEYKRKYEETIARQAYQPTAPPVPKENDAWANVPPETRQLLDMHYQQMRNKENLKAAYEYILENKMSVQEVDTIAAEYGLSNADPLQMVKKAHKLKLALAPKQTLHTVVNKEKEQERINKIKKATTEAGSKPPEPRPKESETLKVKFKESGTVDALTALFRKQMDETETK